MAYQIIKAWVNPLPLDTLVVTSGFGAKMVIARIVKVKSYGKGRNTYYFYKLKAEPGQGQEIRTWRGPSQIYPLDIPSESD